MRFLAILVLASLFVANFGLKKPAISGSRCPKKCRLRYNPVCGIRFGSEVPNHCTFLNLCLLLIYLCKTKQKWVTLSFEACQDNSPNCEDILTYFRNHTDLITHENIEYYDQD